MTSHGQPQGHPSSTAVTAAAARAAHLIVDRPPVIFADTLAQALLGEQAEELLGYHRARGDHPILAAARAQATCRSRYTEDRVADCVTAGVRQCLILGAGLDTFAYRSETAPRVRVFEVDHPASQQDKRRRLDEAKIAIPDNVTHVPVDFETASLADSLAAHGFDPALPAVVAWLGVSMYLTLPAVSSTLAVIGGFAPGTELIMDYMLPPELRDRAGQMYADSISAHAAERGEPWRSFFAPDDLTELLSAHGLHLVEHVRQSDVLDGALRNRQDALTPGALSCLARARVPARGH